MNWSRTLCVVMLLGVAILPGCAGRLDVAPSDTAQEQDNSPAPGTVIVHMNGSVTGLAAVGH
jgi:hypothetical protein